MWQAWGATLRHVRTGGPKGNERLTATAAVVVLLLLALEGATILFIRPLLSLHMCVGVMLIPPLVVKLGSTGYRFARYYTGDPAYRGKGPPWLFMRLIAPALLAATTAVIGSGVYLLATGQRAGIWIGVHKTSFVVWLALASVHVVVYVWRLPSLVLDRRVPGFALRVGLVAVAVVAGLWIADETALHDRFT